MPESKKTWEPNFAISDKANNLAVQLAEHENQMNIFFQSRPAQGTPISSIFDSVYTSMIWHRAKLGIELDKELDKERLVK